MSGKRSRRKGRAGETEAKNLLLDRDYDVTDISAGVSDADLIAVDSDGVAWSVEVKNRRIINIAEFRKQAIDNAGRKRWMVMCKLEGCGAWLVLRQGENPVVWR